ncbi:hypothetical protein [Mycetocola saprophilus]|uniref:hypothetical protein n=1 Tax=Mycetocola saprophilus TaxID=76636 RepID=UPI0004C05370|nr:hypothetical protein [Mycetocola saprophilus]
MSEHNRAIRMAQKLLRRRAEQFEGHENANRDWVESPKTLAFIDAASELDTLIEDEEASA